ncbi:hypothetical protein BLNAU_4042 [Blattamonas nauphoetae]|uniref:Uncharacterized protein n=1 Tax=Blattamonas nauphoetae TaxID=2049346 RepID=A0ABQ9YB13_9EUKA|nr:hypothetical protein BLNAU_4042 [Blattamonas nauphoetae]
MKISLDPLPTSTLVSNFIDEVPTPRVTHRSVSALWGLWVADEVPLSENTSAGVKGANHPRFGESIDQNFIFTTSFSFPPSTFAKHPIGVASCAVVVEDRIVNMGGLDGDELHAVLNSFSHLASDSLSDNSFTLTVFRYDLTKSPSSNTLVLIQDGLIHAGLLCAVRQMIMSLRFSRYSQRGLVGKDDVGGWAGEPMLGANLEAKAVNLLRSLYWYDRQSVDVFLGALASISDASSTYFVKSIEPLNRGGSRIIGSCQSIVVLVSSPSQIIRIAGITMLSSLMTNCSEKIRFSLVKTDLIPQLITSLNPLSLSFAIAEKIHAHLMSIITDCFWPSTPVVLQNLGFKDGIEKQAVYETIFKQVLMPSEKYIWHLCMNRFSIVFGAQSECFLTLLARILQISPFYPPTMDFVLHMPIVLTIPSCLTFFDHEPSIRRELNKKQGGQRQMWQTVQRLLRMEGIEDVIEGKQQNNKKRPWGRAVVEKSIEITSADISTPMPASSFHARVRSCPAPLASLSLDCPNTLLPTFQLLPTLIRAS